MKTRTSFVSNSSSSSFVIQKSDLSKRQIRKIHNHGALAKEYMLFHPGEDIDLDYQDEWSISETENEISGYTSMDNFDMNYFLHVILNINPDKIKWDD